MKNTIAAASKNQMPKSINLLLKKNRRVFRRKFGQNSTPLCNSISNFKKSMDFRNPKKKHCGQRPQRLCCLLLNNAKFNFFCQGEKNNFLAYILLDFLLYYYIIIAEKLLLKNI